VRRTLLLLFLAAAAVAATACTADPHPLRWGYTFERPEDRARAVVVEAVIAEGACDGMTVFETLIELSAGVSPDQPGPLDPGHYCLRGRARDIDCNWFVSGALELDLPTEQSPNIVVLRDPESGAACPSGECSAGHCTGDMPDGGMDSSMIDSAVDSGGDAAPDTRVDSRPPDTGVIDGCTSMTEVCNGADDDCDGRIDEDFDLGNDDSNCGSCGTTCMGDTRCMMGSCDCPPGFTFDPPSRCIDTTADPSNCGAIDNRCRDDQWCQDSSCECRPGLTDVGGACRDLSTDPENCGSIGNDCSTMGSMITCRNSCEDSCNAGQTNCSNACIDDTDFSSNDLHCGTCGNACGRSSVCRGGACERYVVATACSSCPCGDCGAMGFESCSSYGSATICFGE
jgi:hypothetical protein